MYRNGITRGDRTELAYTHRRLGSAARIQAATPPAALPMRRARVTLPLILTMLCTPLWFVQRTILGRLGELTLTLGEVAMLAAFLVCWLTLRTEPASLHAPVRRDLPWVRRLDRLQVWFAIGLVISFLVGNVLLGFASAVDGLRFLRQYLLSTLVAYQLGRLLGRFEATSSRYLFYLASVALGLALLISPSFVQPAHDVEGEVIGTLNVGIGTISIGGNTTALFLLIFALCGWAYLLFGTSLLARAAGGSLVAVTAWRLWLLSTRAVLIALPLCLAVLLIIRARDRRTGRLLTRRFWLIALPLSILIAYAVWRAFPALLERASDFQLLKLGTLLDVHALREQESLSLRLDQYPAYLPVLLTTPTGLGIADIYVGTYLMAPHGLLLQLLAKSGWIGGASYLLFMILATYQWYKTGIRAKAVYAALLSAMVVVNLTFLAMAWGYDFFQRFAYQATYMALCGLTTSVAARLQRQQRAESVAEG